MPDDTKLPRIIRRMRVTIEPYHLSSECVQMKVEIQVQGRETIFYLEASDGDSFISDFEHMLERARRGILLELNRLK